MTRPITTSLASALALSLVLGGCGDDISAPASDLATDPALSQHTHPGQGAEHAARQATLAQQLNAVRKATTKYRDVAEARADGYFAVSPYVPGMGFHFADELPPFGTDREDPGVLVYFTTGDYNPGPGEAHDPAHDDDLVLGAVEWLVPGDQTGDPPDLFADEDSPRVLKTTEEEGWHFEAAEGFTGLHAWVHRGNPAGVFHATNPTIN